MPRTKSKKPLLSVIIPAYNEENTILSVINQVRKSGIKPLEIIVVDDASSDKTPKILKKAQKKVHKIITHKRNQGKGAALRSGFKAATGQIVIIQDADLEYDPADFKDLIAPIVDGKADVVYGSRFSNGKPHRVVYFWHYLANNLLTMLSNMFTNLNLTDMETGYKVFKLEVIKKISLEENSFGIEPEITAKVAKMKAKIYEVGISYSGRTYEEGKKIGLKDAFVAVWAIFKYNVLV